MPCEESELNLSAFAINGQASPSSNLSVTG